MTRADLGNALAIAAALALAAAASAPGRAPEASAAPPEARATPALDVRRLPDGRRALVDATGHPVPLRDYRRIVAGSTVSRELLAELAERDRIAGVIDYALDDSAEAFRFAGVPRLKRVTDVEAVLALRPDLVLVHGIRDPARVTRLREAGLEVFDLGQMRGLIDLEPNLHQVAALLGAPERGAHAAAALRRRLAAVAADVPADARRAGMYVSVYGDRMLGGAAGSSFHDVLTAAGLVDAAAAAGYRGWPQYSAEDLLRIAPEVVVTQSGMGQRLCSQPGLDGLAVCAGDRAAVVELPRDVLISPGLTMLEAAEQLRARAYGAR